MKFRKIALIFVCSMLIIINRSSAQTDQFIQVDPNQEVMLNEEIPANNIEFKELTISDFSKSIWNQIVAGIKYSFFTIKQATSDILSIEPAPTPEPGVISAVKKANTLAPNTGDTTSGSTPPPNQVQITNTRRSGSSGSNITPIPTPNINTTRTTTAATPRPTSTVSPRPSATVSPSSSPTPTPTPSTTISPSPIITPTPTPTSTPSSTATPSPTPSSTPTPTPSTTISPSPTITPTPTPTPSNSPRASYNQPTANLYEISKILFDLIVKINDQNYPILHKK